MSYQGRCQEDGWKSGGRALRGGWRRNGWKTVYVKKGDLAGTRKALMADRAEAPAGQESEHP